VPQIEVTFDIDANGIVHVTPRTWPPARSSPQPGAQDDDVVDAEYTEHK
jgi:molecular chaperone DnaK (HSP70)